MFALLSVVLAPTGCALTGLLVEQLKCPRPTHAEVVFVAKSPINMDTWNRSSATEVMVFQVTALAGIKDATLGEVSANPEILGEELVGQDRAVVYEDRPAPVLKFALESAARHLVFVGVFQQSQGTAWRALYELPATEAEYCKVGSTIHMRYELSSYQISGGLTEAR
jgi:type VI secretion system VasD/TssJ family lipoprotein